MRVAIADDGPLFQQGLAVLLDAADVEVVGSANDSESALRVAETERPDVIILDIRMPPLPDGGLVAGRQLRTLFPRIGLLFLSNYAETHYLVEILKIGTEGVGYRQKDLVASVETLQETIRRVASGEMVIEPHMARRLVERPRDSSDGLEELTQRETEVLTLMAEGHSNRSIAEKLVINAGGVEKHIASIFVKLNLPADKYEYHRRVKAVIMLLKSSAGTV